MCKLKILLLLSLFFMPLVSAAIDEEDDLLSLYDDDELISIATGTAKQVRFAPSVATVITADDIKRIGARTLDEALETVPGLHVSRSFNRQDPIYSIRGIHTSQNPQVLLLVDGVRIQQTFTGARPFNFEMPVSNIKRIEVIRGPGSAIHGADAFAGVISVVTRTAVGIDAAELGFRAGSFQRQEGWGQFTEFWDSIRFDLSVEYSKTDGDRDRRVNSDQQSRDDPALSNAPGPLETDSEYWTTRARLSQKAWSLDLFSWHLVSAGVGTGGAQALDPDGRDKEDLYGFKFNIEPIGLGNDWLVESNLGASVLKLDADFVLFPEGATFLGPTFSEGVIGNPSYKDITYSSETTLTWNGSSSHAVRAGIGFKYHDFDASETKNFDINLDTFVATPLAGVIDVTDTPLVYIDDVNREQYYFYIQDEWSFSNDWQATLGLRYDEFTQFGGSINPRLALVWSTTHNLTSKFLYGRAFRAPSFSELFAKKNPSLLGNPKLDPEVIDTYEIAFDYRPTHDFSTRLNLFYFEIEDLVAINFGTEASNSLEQSGFGFEVEFDWDISDSVRLLGNYAWFDAEDDTTRSDVANAASSQLYLSAEWKINDKRTLSILGNRIEDRKRVDGDLRSDIDDYTLVNLVFRTLTRYDGLEFAFIGKNIFDEDIRAPSTSQVLQNGMLLPSDIPDDYPEEGRSLNFEISYRFDR